MAPRWMLSLLAVCSLVRPQIIKIVCCRSGTRRRCQVFFIHSRIEAKQSFSHEVLESPQNSRVTVWIYMFTVLNLCSVFTDEPIRLFLAGVMSDQPDHFGLVCLHN